RFMDDILVLAPTRWKLRRAVRLVNEILGALRFGEASRQDRHRPDLARFRFPRLSLQPRGAGAGQGHDPKIRRTCSPALRARAGATKRLLSARGVCPTVGRLGKRWVVEPPNGPRQCRPGS